MAFGKKKKKGLGSLLKIKQKQKTLHFLINGSFVIVIFLYMHNDHILYFDLSKIENH